MFMRLRDDMPRLNGATDWLNCEAVQREELIGEPTLIHFWSISCNECKIALPHISQLRDEYYGRLNVIAVHMPRSTEDLYLEDVEKVARAYDISEPIYIDNDHILTDKFTVRYVPAYFVFDADGKLRYLQSGDSSIKMLLKRIERLI